MPVGAGTNGAFPRSRRGNFGLPQSIGGCTKQGGAAVSPWPEASRFSPPLGLQSKLSIAPSGMARLYAFGAIYEFARSQDGREVRRPNERPSMIAICGR